MAAIGGRGELDNPTKRHLHQVVIVRNWDRLEVFKDCQGLRNFA